MEFSLFISMGLLESKELRIQPGRRFQPLPGRSLRQAS